MRRFENAMRFVLSAAAVLLLALLLTLDLPAQQSTLGRSTGGSFISPSLTNATILNAETTWPGATNTVTVGGPYKDYYYTVTNDVSFSAIAGTVAGVRLGASLVLTNGVGSNCTIYWPAVWKAYGTALADGTVTITNGGKMLKLEIESNGTSYTNVVGAFAQ